MMICVKILLSRRINVITREVVCVWSMIEWVQSILKLQKYGLIRRMGCFGMYTEERLSIFGILLGLPFPTYATLEWEAILRGLSSPMVVTLVWFWEWLREKTQRSVWVQKFGQHRFQGLVGCNKKRLAASWVKVQGLVVPIRNWDELMGPDYCKI